MSEVDKRNIQALEQANKQLNEMVRAQQIRVDGLLRTVGNLVERVAALEQLILKIRATAQGTGPTT
jgi:hypothetical protein